MFDARSGFNQLRATEQAARLMRKSLSAARNRPFYRAMNAWRTRWSYVTHQRQVLSQQAARLVHRDLARALSAWIQRTEEALIYYDVAAMQFSHVVVNPKTDDAPRSIEYIWRSANRDKLDWALLHASQAGHLATVQTLLGRGAQVGVADGLDQNALHVAAFAGYADVVRELLDAEGTDIDAEDACGHTALLLASLRGHHAIMLLLAEAGAADATGAGGEGSGAGRGSDGGSVGNGVEVIDGEGAEDVHDIVVEGEGGGESDEVIDDVDVGSVSVDIGESGEGAGDGEQDDGGKDGGGDLGSAEQQSGSRKDRKKKGNKKGRKGEAAM